MTRHCRRCHAPVPDSAHYCSQCGASVSAQPSGPPHSAPHSTKPHAEEPLEITTFVPRPNHRRRAWIVLALLIVVVGFAWWLRTRQGRRTDEELTEVTPAPVITSGPPLRTIPAEVLNDPAGSVVRVPERKAADTGKVFWRTIPVPPELATLKLAAPVMRFDSSDSLTIHGRTTVELPCDDPEATVLVRGSLGLWVPLPSESVTRRDGRPARRVTIDSEPTPWLFAVTAEPSVRQLPSDSIVAEMLDFERRHWTSQTLTEAEIRQPPRDEGRKAAGAARSAATFESVVQAQAPEAGREKLRQTTATAWRTLRRISTAFHDEGTLQHMRRGGIDPMTWAWQQYRHGISLLATLRREPRDVLASVPMQAPPWFLGPPISADPWGQGRSSQSPPGTFVDPEVIDLWEKTAGQNVLRIVEMLAAEYAPWGIEYVEGLIDEFPVEKDGALFDLRVLTPVGNLKFCDIPLPPNVALPASVASALQSMRPIRLANEGRTPFLRLYSSSTVNLDWYRWFLELTDDGVMRWGPVLYGTAQFVGYAAGAVVLTNPVSELGWFVWSLSAAVLAEANDWYLKSQDVSGDVYNYNEYLETLVLDGLETRARWLATKSGGVYQLGTVRLESTPADLQKNIGMIFVSLSVAYLLQDAEMGLLQEIRNIPTGRAGYCGGKVPPSLYYVFVNGNPPDPPNYDRYPTRIDYAAWFWLDYEKLYPADLSATLGGVGAGNGPSGRKLAALPFEPYQSQKKDRWWVTVDDKTPDEQLIRLALSRDLIERQMIDQGISDTPWDRIPFDRLGLFVSLRSRDGQLHLVRPLEEFTNESNGAADERAAAMRIHLTGRQLAPSTYIPEGYRAEAITLNRLRATYELSVVAASGEDAAKSASPITVPLEITLTPERGGKPMIGRFREVFGANMQQAWILLDAGPLTPALSNPEMSVEPNDLSHAQSNRMYVFDVRIRNVSAGEPEVRFVVRYPDGSESKTTQPAPGGVAGATFRRSFSQGTSGELLFEARSTKSPQVLGSVRVPISTGVEDDLWHFAGTTVEDIVPKIAGVEVPLRSETEGFASLVFSNNSVSASFFSKNQSPDVGDFEFAFRGEWGSFPSELKPGQKLRIPVTISRTWSQQPKKGVRAGYIGLGTAFEKEGTHTFETEIRAGEPGERLTFVVEAVPLNAFWRHRLYKTTYIYGGVHLPQPAPALPVGTNPFGEYSPPTEKK